MFDIGLQRVEKLYGRPDKPIRALDKVTLEVGLNELVMLVGPSGSGKSTLLRIVAGLEVPNSGTIHLADRDATTDPPNQRDIGMVFQHLALYPHLRVLDNIAFGLRTRSVDKRLGKSRIHHVADALGITDLLDRFPSELSGGERQRVAISRVLVREPARYLLDEPLSGLDIALRERVANILRDRVVNSRAGLWATHDQEQAVRLADRIAVMRHGRIEQLGTPEELLLRPASRWVAESFGRPAMTFLCGDAVQRGKDWFLDAPDGTFRLPSHQASSSRELQLGIRPEHFRPAEPSTENALGVEVKSYARRGRVIEVHAVSRGGVSTTLVRPAGDTLTAGTVLQLTWNTDDAVVFEGGDTGRNLTLMETVMATEISQ